MDNSPELASSREALADIHFENRLTVKYPHVKNDHDREIQMLLWVDPSGENSVITENEIYGGIIWKKEEDPRELYLNVRAANDFSDQLIQDWGVERTLRIFAEFKKPGGEVEALLTAEERGDSGKYFRLLDLAKASLEQRLRSQKLSHVAHHPPPNTEVSVHEIKAYTDNGNGSIPEHITLSYVADANHKPHIKSPLVTETRVSILPSRSYVSPNGNSSHNGGSGLIQAKRWDKIQEEINSLLPI